MKAVVLTPAYTHVHHDLQRVILRAGIPWLPLYGHSDLPRVRSILIEQGLAKGAERLILVDADTIPTTDGLVEMAESPEVTPERALWGMYPLRGGESWSVNPDDPRHAGQAITEGQRFRIRTGGLGFCAIHRESLLRVAAPLSVITEATGNQWRPFCVPFVRDHGATPARYYADDASLCWRLWDSGTALWCDPKLRAGHAATTILTEPHPLG